MYSLTDEQRKRIEDIVFKAYEEGRQAGLEEAAIKCEKLYAAIDKQASNNSDRYHSQDETCTRCAKAIRALKGSK